MRVRISILTPEKSLTDYFGLGKVTRIPKGAVVTGYLAKIGAEIVVTTYLCTPEKTLDEFLEHIDEISSDADALIILYDHRYGYMIRDFRKSVFAASFLDTERVNNFSNYFGSVTARTLRNFAFFASRFFDGKYQKPLLLPLKNFHAETMVEIMEILGEDAPNDFQERLDLAISSLRKRQTPKKTDDYNTVYYLDDRDRYFHYGHELHSLPETASPHSFGCYMTSKFRFGGRYNEQRHFNVSLAKKRQKVAGIFQFCHDGEDHEEGNPHLNMFPNDQVV